MLNNKEEFNKIIYDIEQNETVQQMKKFRQHYDTSCYEHCKNVAYYSYRICKKFKLDYVSMARAAMLHDLFLYDWRVKDPNRKGFHGTQHPKIAYENASKLFDLNDKEKDIILKHMWPVTFTPPKYIESFIITLTDKYSATVETFKGLRKYRLPKIYRYAYVFICFLVLPIFL